MNYILLVIMKAFVHLKKSLALILMNQTRNIILVFIIMLILGKEMFNNKNVIFPTQFCLGSIFDGFSAT